MCFVGLLGVVLFVGFGVSDLIGVIDVVDMVFWHYGSDCSCGCGGVLGLVGV